MMNNLALKATTELADGTNQNVYSDATSYVEGCFVTDYWCSESSFDSFITASLQDGVHSFDTGEGLTELSVEEFYYITHDVDERVSTSGVSAYFLCKVCVEGGNEYSWLAVNYIRNGITSRFIFPFLGSGFIDGTDFYCISYFVFFAVPGLFTEDNMISC
jgi:hypothetical protein